jgi:hypothetical protein
MQAQKEYRRETTKESNKCRRQRGKRKKESKKVIKPTL